jgi:hypothetical protein
MDYLWFWIAREVASLLMFVAVIIGIFTIGWICFEWQAWTKRREHKRAQP